ncbi:MBL fold metallo-hydrolase [Virgibacillus sp. LDC-1]|uniref:MBL fold metallo-hydrolase n=1 Tax=Virgibacillus sp. LDC-1 TaxID=3039856 RepID=UPI0024DEA214|nr:MBL fold metallo-hydrolase [Virgibacillus sp. LDC-1]
MKLTVIGYWGAYPKENEATACYLIEQDETKILFDCGSGALSQLTNYISINEIDAVFISHIHADHIADLYCLEYAMRIQQQLGNRNSALDVYIYTEDLNHLPLEYPTAIRAHSINLTSVIKVGKLEVTFAEMLHEIPTCAIKATNAKGTSLVYSGDSGYTPNLIRFSQDADLLLIECSFYQRQKGYVKGHLSTTEVGEIASKANVGELVLTHLPHFGDISQLINEVRPYFQKKISKAHTGLSILL